MKREAGTPHSDVDINKGVEMIFLGLLGASVRYASDKSVQNLNMTINTLVEYLTQISN